MVIQLREKQRCRIRLNGGLSELFPITNGVKKDCVLSPTPFSAFFGMMLKQVTDDLDNEDGVYVRYRLDGSLVNLRHLQAHSKNQESQIKYLLFANYAALVAHAEQVLKRITFCLADASHVFGLVVSFKKTPFSLPVYLPSRVPTTPRHHWQRRAEIDVADYLPGLHHLI